MAFTAADVKTLRERTGCGMMDCKNALNEAEGDIDKAMETVRANIVHFQKIKTGEIPAERCEDYGCDWCTSTKIITEPIDTDLFGMSTAQIRSMRGDI